MGSMNLAVLSRRFLLTSLLAALAFNSAPVHAEKTPPVPIAKPAEQAKSIEPDEAALQTHDHYKNKAGQTVHSPAKSANGAVPAGASAKCRDGTFSFSRNHRGTCSHHSGVAAWL
jgi:hypothetical protein